jgi:predicted P-loop ATPase
VTPPGGPGGPVNDLEERLCAVVEGAEVVEADWERHPKTGTILTNSVRNARIAAKRLAIAARYDELADKGLITVADAAEEQIVDPIVDRLWFKAHEMGFKPARDFWYRFLSDLARQRSFHPVRDYLRGLKWDGVERLPTWLVVHLGAKDTPFNRAVGTCWMIGGAARVMKPGCLMKNVLVIEGPQDLGKSKAFGILAVRQEYFTDHLSDLSRKDALEETLGKWIIEFAEFDAMRRAENNRLKSFLATLVDHFRPSYERKARDFPRQWVGVATINPGGTGYLKDETGNVRFWPVECAVGWPEGQKIDAETLMAVRDQLWAEATCRYDRGEKWWLADAEIEKEQREAAAERLEDDPREKRLREIVEGRLWIQMDDILLGLGYGQAERDMRGLQTQIGALMVRLGWMRWRGRSGGPNGPGYYYFPPGAGDLTVYAASMTAKVEEAASEAMAEVPS